MFREIAIVTFTAGMLGTSAATLSNAFDSDAAAPPPAIERASAAAPAQTDRPDPKRDPDLVALELSQR